MVRAYGPVPVPVELPAIQITGHKAMRGAWSDPEDLNPLRREARQIKGYRTFCSLRRMAGNTNSGIGPEHIAAADKLRENVDIARFGFTGERPLLPAQISAQPRPGPSGAELARTRAIRVVVRVWRIFTPDQQRLLIWVVLDNGTVQDWTRYRESQTGQRCDRNVEKGRLLSLLDQLVLHFGTEVSEELRLGRRLPA